MTALGCKVAKIRSKNAGPFWLTVDVFCHDSANFNWACGAVDTSAVAQLFGVNTQDIKRFDIADLSVIKLSLPRPNVQGTRADRDMHGAGFACLLEEMEV